MLTPWLKAATQSPVASPSRHPISSSAHSGGAPSPRASAGGGRSNGSKPPSWCLRLGRRPDSLRSNCFNRPVIPLFFDPGASKSGSEFDEFDRIRRMWSPESTSSDIFFRTCSHKTLENEQRSKEATKAQIFLEWVLAETWEIEKAVLTACVLQLRGRERRREDAMRLRKSTVRMWSIMPAMVPPIQVDLFFPIKPLILIFPLKKCIFSV